METPTTRTDRAAEARAEAGRRFPGYGIDVADAYAHDFFLDGAEWADANPQPHTITRSGLRDTAMMLAHTRQDEIEAMLPGLLGIEVEDDSA